MAFHWFQSSGIAANLAALAWRVPALRPLSATLCGAMLSSSPKVSSPSSAAPSKHSLTGLVAGGFMYCRARGALKSRPRYPLALGPAGAGFATSGGTGGAPQPLCWKRCPHGRGLAASPALGSSPGATGGGAGPEADVWGWKGKGYG